MVAMRSMVRAVGLAKKGVFRVARDSFAPRYNVAPTDVMPIAILKEGRSVLVAARWGLVTPHSKDVKSAAKRINAPSQNVMKWAASLVEPLGEERVDRAFIARNSTRVRAWPLCLRNSPTACIACRYAS